MCCACTLFIADETHRAPTDADAVKKNTNGG